MSPARTSNAEQFGFDPNRVKPCVRSAENPERQFHPTDPVEPRDALGGADDAIEDTSRRTMGTWRHARQIGNAENLHDVSGSNHPAVRVSRWHSETLFLN